MFALIGSVLILLAAIVHAQGNYTIPVVPVERCIDSRGYEACAAPIVDTFSKCQNDARGDTDAVSGCAVAGSQLFLNCAYENCWNIVGHGSQLPADHGLIKSFQAYSCEVQELAVAAVWSSPITPSLPYFPAPADAPGRCSCNLEEVVVAFGGSAGGGLSNCFNSLASSSSADAISNGLDGCTCCAQAGAYSGLFSICPDVDPKFLLQNLPGAEFALAGGYTPLFPDCGPTLQVTSCENDLGYPALPGGVSYLSMVPASSATGSYSNLPGTLQSPVSQVLTYSAPGIGQVLTATAAMMVAGGDQDTATISTPSTNAINGGVGSSTSTATDSVRPTSNAGVINNSAQYFVLGPVVVLSCILTWTV
ncbi:hypothetical protein Slin14017_G122790 [Septoria linicola]|nr:hypothetical protein Slin14017_G122790 [Septoria linicola]